MLGIAKDFVSILYMGKNIKVLNQGAVYNVLTLEVFDLSINLQDFFS